jgi:hypothetical protein
VTKVASRINALDAKRNPSRLTMKGTDSGRAFPVQSQPSVAAAATTPASDT